MPVCVVCTAALVSVVHILLKKIMRHTGVPSIFISNAARARATHIVMITTVPALTSRGGTPPIMLRTFSLLSSMLSFSSMLRFLSFFFLYVAVCCAGVVCPWLCMRLAGCRRLSCCGGLGSVAEFKLVLYQLVVHPALLGELLVSACLCHVSAVYHHYVVGMSYRAQPVCHYHHRAPFVEAA